MPSTSRAPAATGTDLRQTLIDIARAGSDAVLERAGADARRTAAKPDELDLYETLAVASGDVKASVDTIYAVARSGHLWPGATSLARRDARAAALRIIKALDEFEAAI